MRETGTLSTRSAKVHRRVKSFLQKGISGYRSEHGPVDMNSPLGKTKMFVIPDEDRKLTPTTKGATYVEIVRLVIEESFENKMKETNLKALDRAIDESTQRVSCQRTTYDSRLLKF